MFAEDGSNPADDAGLIAVGDDEHRSTQGSLDTDPIERDQSRPAALEDGALDPPLALSRPNLDRDQARVISWARTPRLDDFDAVLRRHATGVDNGDARRQHRLEQARQHAVDDHTGAALCQLTVIPEADLADSLVVHLSNERAEPLA